MPMKPSAGGMQGLIEKAAPTLAATAALAQDKLDLTAEKSRASYAIGADIANSMKRQSLDLDTKALAAGLVDGMTGKLQLKDTDLEKAMNDFKTALMAKRQAAQATAATENTKKGTDYLAANAKKDGVKTTTSGLQYKVMKAGPDGGKSPKATDTVKVHYHGTLIDGTVFDSSVQRGEPISFPLNGVIPGWTEGVQLMKVGDKFQFTIPSALAYGEQGAGGTIGPNSTLIFEVELLGVEAGRTRCVEGTVREFFREFLRSRRDHGGGPSFLRVPGESE
jgi:FKBP-type peptidyl-prolyl cis-trans isomerase